MYWYPKCFTWELSKLTGYHIQGKLWKDVFLGGEQSVSWKLMFAVTAFYHEILVYGELDLKNRWYFSRDGFSGSVTWSQGTMLVSVIASRWSRKPWRAALSQWPPVLDFAILGFPSLPGRQQDAPNKRRLGKLHQECDGAGLGWLAALRASRAFGKSGLS